MPRQSKPGPRFEVLAGTRTVTCCFTSENDLIAPGKSGKRGNGARIRGESRQVRTSGSWIDSQLMRDFQAEKTNAHRLCTASDGWVERFGADVLVSFKSETARERLTTEYFLWADTVGFTLSRMFARFLPKRNAEREAPRLLLGDQQANLRTVVMERCLQYGIDFGAGYSVGLFVDQRENRRFVRKVEPTRLLNCFAYTCSFSVAAASNRCSIDRRLCGSKPSLPVKIQPRRDPGHHGSIDSSNDSDRANGLPARSIVGRCQARL